MRNFASPLRSITCVAIMTAGATAQAESVTFESLLDGGTITSGNLTFSDFSYISQLDGPDPSTIGVLDIDGGIAFGSPLAVTGDEAIEFEYSFVVTAATPITGVALSTTAAVSGGGSVSFDEGVFGSDNVLIAGLPTVQDGDVAEPDAAAVTFGDLTSITILQGVSLQGNGGFATLSDFDYTISTGSETAVPSPSAAAAGLLGMVGLLARRRRNA